MENVITEIEQNNIQAWQIASLVAVATGLLAIRNVLDKLRKRQTAIVRKKLFSGLDSKMLNILSFIEDNDKKVVSMLELGHKTVNYCVCISRCLSKASIYSFFLHLAYLIWISYAPTRGISYTELNIYVISNILFLGILLLYGELIVIYFKVYVKILIAWYRIVFAWKKIKEIRRRKAHKQKIDQKNKLEQELKKLSDEIRKLSKEIKNE